MSSRRLAGFARGVVAAACSLWLLACHGAPAPDTTPPGAALPVAGAPGILAGGGETAEAGDMGSIALRVRWPRTIASIPASTRLLVIFVYDQNMVSRAQLRIQRPTTDERAYNVSLPVKRGGPYTIVANAYRDLDVSDAQLYHVPIVAQGAAGSVRVYANTVTPVSLELSYRARSCFTCPLEDVMVTGLAPDNGGPGAQVELQGTGFFGFVDPLHATASFEVFFARYYMDDADVPFSRPTPGPTYPATTPTPWPQQRIPGVSAGTVDDRWLRVPEAEARRVSSTSVLVVVPDGAVNGWVEYQVDGVSASWYHVRKRFTVLRELQIRGQGEGDFKSVSDIGLAEATLEVGKSKDLRAAATDSLGFPFAKPAVTWLSSNPGVGFVDPAGGLFWAYSPGQTRVTASSGRVAASILVTVKARPGAPPDEFHSTASFDVPLPAMGGTASFGILLPPFDGGNLVGTGSP